MLIFIPVRNGGAYLAKAINSLVAQSDPDWRLVVLENASTDDTVATVASYGDSRIEIVPAATPLGIVENWQRVAAYIRDRNVNGDMLVTIVGADDYLLPHFVESIGSLARLDPAATLYQTAFDLVDGEDRLIRPCRPIPATESWTDLGAALCWNIRDSFGTGYAFRARDYLEVGGMPDLPLLLSSDHLLFVRLARLGHKRADARAGCAYRFHTGSTSGGMSRAKINAHVEGLAGYVDALLGMGLDTTEQGRNALAALLGRELWTLQLPVVGRVLTLANRQRRVGLETLFAKVSRGIPLMTWADPEGGGFARLTSRARRMARSLSLYRQTRR